jgi:phosphoglycerate dehydrogenase-like enzyme
MKLLFCGSGWLPIAETMASKLPPQHQLAIWDRTRPLMEAVADADVLLPSNARIHEAVLAAATKLRLIQQPAVGTEGIEIAAAVARGIPVCNAPGVNHLAVAEAALLLILALARRLAAAQQAFRDRQIGATLGRQLGGRALGIIGPGRSGNALAERALALGMRVQLLGRDATVAERDAFFASCDVISVHCPLNDQTRGMIGARALATMKRGVHLINVARGPVLDRDAVVSALLDGHLGGLGLDVHWHEPWDPDDEIYRDPRVVALPHIAGSTEESAANVTAILLDNLERLERGQPLLHRVDGG